MDFASLQSRSITVVVIGTFGGVCAFVTMGWFLTGHMSRTMVTSCACERDAEGKLYFQSQVSNSICL